MSGFLTLHGSKPKACRNYAWRAVQAERAAAKRKRKFVTSKGKRKAKVTA